MEPRKKVRSRIIAVALLLAVVYAFRSRPMTIQQRYPMLTLDKCTGIQGYYYDGTGVALKEFAIDKSSEEFEKLWDLLYEREYRRSLKDLLPRGTRTHRSEPGDFQWKVYFCFENIEMPDGNGFSGTLLCFDRWYSGDLDIEIIDERHYCYTNEQEAWAKEVLDIIR